MAQHSKTRYQVKWEKEYPFLKPVPGNDYSAKCTYCSAVFKVDKQGVQQVKSHASGKKHHEKAAIFEGSGSQTRLVQGNRDNDRMGLSQIPTMSKLTRDQEIQNAEIIQALSFVEHNYSFASAQTDSKKFQKMFPDSKIAEGYKQSATKVKYVIQYGIAPYILNCDKEEVRNSPYSFKFDETTNACVKRQYDAHIQYWSRKRNGVTTMYVGSLFIGHCKSKDIIIHLFEMLKNLDLKPTLLLHLGMDGPNVNLKFEQELAKLFTEQYGSNFLTVGTCTLHKVHNAFRKGMNACDFDFESFIFDVAFFFKRSACRREDYKTVEMITNLETRFALKHVSSRWLSMRKVCLRILEQWPNLVEYFLTFLPSQENTGNEMSTSRYQRIVEVLTNPLHKATFCFVVFVSQEFEYFLKTFQRNELMIHLLYDAMLSLLRSLMTKFMKKTALRSEGEEENDTLLNVDLQKKHKKITKIDVGTHAKAILLSNNLSEEKVIGWRKSCLAFYEATVTYLRTNLPYENKVLKDARYLMPEKRNDCHALRAISRLTMTVAKSLHLNLYTVFGINESVEDICDKVRSQWRLYELENILKIGLFVTPTTEKQVDLKKSIGNMSKLNGAI